MLLGAPYQGRMPFRFRAALSALLLGALSAAPALAQEAAPIRLELNRLEARAEGCRVWLLLGNPGAEAVDPLRLDLVLFDRGGVVARRLAVEAGPLAAAKTTVRIFDVPGQPCDAIGGVLMNDVLACGPTPEGRAACLARLTLSSRPAGVTFEK